MAARDGRGEREGREGRGKWGEWVAGQQISVARWPKFRP